MLRIIAGLEAQDSGEVVVAGRCVDDKRPKERDVAMVFQSYALYPHLSVFDNVGSAAADPAPELCAAAAICRPCVAGTRRH